MSVFSKIKLSRKAAKEHKVKAVEKEAEQETAAPYKHVPTHAAVDALSGAPSSWKYQDLSKIKEHHKRRSQMGISRTGSSVSNMSYMNATAGPSLQAPPFPRASSYHSHNSTWNNRDGDVYYLNEPTQKRPRPPRGHSYHDSGIGLSPLATALPSNEPSPVVSSGNSTTSNSSENLEIPGPSNPNPERTSQRPQPTVYEERDIFQRLHTSTTRKLGEAPLHDSPPVVEKPVVNVVAPEPKQKKPRWSLTGKKNATTIAV